MKPLQLAQTFNSEWTEAMDAGLAAIRIDFLGQLHQQCLM
jgi:hypothetical protein